MTRPRRPIPNETPYVLSTSADKYTPAKQRGVLRQREDGGMEVVHPAFGYGSDDGLTGRGKAADEDRETRQKWAGRRHMKSPYLRRIAIPDEVGPNDHDTARGIVMRVRACLDMEYQWTHAERARLRRMEKDWAERAAGRSPIFNLLGWKRVQKWKGRGEWEDYQAALTVDRIIRDLRGTFE